MAISRSKWDSFIKCPLCFYLKEKHNIDPPSTPRFNINMRVDNLLKEEFDELRVKGEPHPIFKEYNLNFVPYNGLDPETLKKYRFNRSGVRAKSKKTGIEIFGALDDLWLNKDTDEIVVLDYKATSNKKLEDYTSSDKHYHKSYLRQLDFYAYLLKLNDFKVHDTGYWLICNAQDESQKTFNKKVNFKTTLLPYKLNTDYIEDTLVELKACLDSEKMPNSGSDCDNCRWYNEKLILKKGNNNENIKAIEIINTFLPSLVEMVKMQSNAKISNESKTKKFQELMEKNENEFKNLKKKLEEIE